jgi:3-deoxy-D-manno-octulosonic-acid transferase
VGEVLAAREMIRLIRENDPQVSLVISVTTKTGYEVAQRTYEDVDLIFFFPMDLSPFVARTFRRIRPDLIVMVELELWPNFFLHARRRGVDIVFVNGRITRRSFEGYRMIGWLLGQVLPFMEVVSVQNKLYGERLVLLGARGDRVKITGNMKYDNIRTAGDADFISRMKAELGLSDGDRPLIGGSIHPGEDEILVSIYTRLRNRFPTLRLILAPRHPEQFDRAQRVVQAAGEEVVRRTSIAQGQASERGAVILLDTVGELSAVYGLAEVIFVGGSMIPHGGQNMLEPAGLGKAVLFGKYTHNFRTDVSLLLDAGAALEVESEEDLESRIIELLEDPAKIEDLGRRARELIEAHKGASLKNFELLQEVFFGRWR